MLSGLLALGASSLLVGDRLVGRSDPGVLALLRRCGRSDVPQFGQALRLDAPGWRLHEGDAAVLVLEAEPSAHELEGLAEARAHAVVVVPADISPATLGELRRGGVVDGTTTLVAIADGDLPRLAQWGVQVVPPGGRVRQGSTAAPVTRTLLLGGARSGKSAEAEAILAAEPAVTYLATSEARRGDAEWDTRVAVHQARRGPHWVTVETDDLVGTLRTVRHPLLIDCLSLWLAGALDRAGAWSEDREEQAQAVDAVRRRVSDLAQAWGAARVRAVAVSSEVGSGVVPATASGRLFRDELGRLNTAVAARSDVVGLVVAGRVLAL